MSDALTVVYQDLSADEKRVIFNDSRVAITEMREIDRIASELQDTCHSQAKRIAKQDALLRQALDTLAYWLEHGETPGSHDMIQRTHDALQERLGETK